MDACGVADWGVVPQFYKRGLFCVQTVYSAQESFGQRLQQVLEPHIEEEQCGFYLGHGTVDQIYKVTELR